MKKDPFKWAWVVVVIAFIIGVGYIITTAEKKIAKPLIEMHENRGKISLYQVQEVEALERFKELEIVKDSITAGIDSLEYQDFEGVDSLGIQAVLDRIFNL